jgi:pimeloyl-ACP methyl ester carboxylesterase
VRGDKDSYITREETDALAAMVGAVRQKTYANTGHALHWEQPAEFARDVLVFVGDTAQRPR